MKHLRYISFVTLCLTMIACGSGDSDTEEKEKPQEETSTSLRPTDELFLNLQNHLNALKDSLSGPENMGSDLGLYDEQGALWKSAPSGFSGNLNEDPFTLSMPFLFQDAANMGLYHFQAEMTLNGETTKWNGNLEVLYATPKTENTDIIGTAVALIQMTQKAPGNMILAGTSTVGFKMDPETENIILAPGKGHTFRGVYSNSDSTQAVSLAWQ